MHRGIIMTGGGALLKGLAQMFETEIKIPVYVAEDPLTAVVRGTGIILEDLDKMREVLIQHDEDIPPKIKTCEKQEKNGFLFLQFLPCLARLMEIKELCGKNNCRGDKPHFQACRLGGRKKDDIFFLFRNKQSLEEELNSLKEKNIELENKAILLESAGKRKRGVENHAFPTG